MLTALLAVLAWATVRTEATGTCLCTCWFGPTPNPTKSLDGLWQKFVAKHGRADTHAAQSKKNYFCHMLPRRARTLTGAGDCSNCAYLCSDLVFCAHTLHSNYSCTTDQCFPE